MHALDFCLIGQFFYSVCVGPTAGFSQEGTTAHPEQSDTTSSPMIPFGTRQSWQIRRWANNTFCSTVNRTNQLHHQSI